MNKKFYDIGSIIIAIKPDLEQGVFIVIPDTECGYDWGAGKAWIRNTVTGRAYWVHNTIHYKDNYEEITHPLERLIWTLK